ncbi:hypothetical protein F2P79_010239, partial [Pimephales promelas]
VLKDYRSLIEMVRNTLPEATIVSGPLPTYRHDYDACGETTRCLWAVSCWIGGGRDHLWLHSLWHETTPWITQRKTRAKTRARTSPPPLPIFEISTRNRFSPLRESERDDAVIIGTSMIRHVRATSGSRDPERERHQAEVLKDYRSLIEMNWSGCSVGQHLQDVTHLVT